MPKVPDFKAHLFICGNERGPGAKRESCCAKGAPELRDRVKNLCRERGLPPGSFRVNHAGCLDICEQGIAAVLYPSGEWFTGLTPADAERLVDSVEKAARAAGAPIAPIAKD